MQQATPTQQHEQPEGGQISQSIPVNGERANLQGNRIDLRMNQHERIVHSGSTS